MDAGPEGQAPEHRPGGVTAWVPPRAGCPLRARAGQRHSGTRAPGPIGLPLQPKARLPFLCGL